MKVLLIGSGGREHALAWKLSQSMSVSKLYCAPGNPGIGELAELVNLAVDNVRDLAQFAEDNKIDLTVVGPEYPLSLGLVDHFRLKGLSVFGPTQAAAALESSKDFAKSIMIKANVPTAKYETFSDKESAWNYLQQQQAPYVIKADSLAAGKGVFIAPDLKAAKLALDEVFDHLKAPKVVIEEFMSGVEASFIVCTDGQRIVPLAIAHDYKRLKDKDVGPNTGGMGTVSPSCHFPSGQESYVIEKIFKPVLAEMTARGTPFMGFLYAGLMIGADGSIKVVEFNCRLGDPETQVIMARLQGDLATLLLKLATGGELTSNEISWTTDTAVCVVMASKDYPAKSSKGDLISGLEEAQAVSGVKVFHAGTALSADGALVTSGGRILNVTAVGPNLEIARQRAYNAITLIKFDGAVFRNDIG